MYYLFNKYLLDVNGDVYKENMLNLLSFIDHTNWLRGNILICRQLYKNIILIYFLLIDKWPATEQEN